MFDVNRNTPKGSVGVDSLVTSLLLVFYSMNDLGEFFCSLMVVNKNVFMDKQVTLLSFQNFT